jgi:hypothetical protein
MANHGATMGKNALAAKVKLLWNSPDYRSKISAAFEKRRAAGIKPRDSALEAEAAEREVVTRLCMLGLMAFQYPRNFRAVDVLAFRERFQKSPRIARISVKFRHSKVATGKAFDIKTLDGVDFVVVLRGGREGFEDIWVIPKAEVKRLAARRTIPRVNFSRIDERYRNAWPLIEQFCK